MTITVYHYNPYGEAEKEYVLDEGNEFTGLLLNGVAFTARAGKEYEGFTIIHPDNIEEIIGKKVFQAGDVLALSDGYELAADVEG